MVSPRRRLSSGANRRSCLMLFAELVVLVFALWRLGVTVLPSGDRSDVSTSEPLPAAAPAGLTTRDVLPTPTPDASRPARLIAFPGASVTAPIVEAGRSGGTWETRHLGDYVGHLVGTSWLNEAGGNIVLAGHVESATGTPGPFKHLFQAQLGDVVILREGETELRYTVTQIESVAPDDVEYLRQDGAPRVTLITCSDWDFERQTYDGRLIVIAEPVTVANTVSAQ